MSDKHRLNAFFTSSKLSETKYTSLSSSAKHPTSSSLTRMTKNDESELKEKVNELISNLKEERIKNNKYKKEFEELQQENFQLMRKERQMIEGYKNSNERFPSEADLKNEISNFVNVKLSSYLTSRIIPDMIYEGTKKFIADLFVKTMQKIENHFLPLKNILNKTLGQPNKNEKNDPLEWILKKSYQENWKSILSSITNKESTYSTLSQLQNEYEIARKDDEASQLEDLLKCALEVLFKCYIMTPNIFFDVNSIGCLEKFSGRRFEPFSPNSPIKISEKCNIIIPGFYKYDESDRKVAILKPKVIALKDIDESTKY